MTDREINFDWRSTMGIAARGQNEHLTVPADIADFIDLATSLAQDDGCYPHRVANRHSCAIDDPIVILHHMRVSGLCKTAEDHRLFDRSIAFVRGHKPMYFCDAEVERRMTQADGHCPMCGTLPSFTGVDHEGRRSMITRCNHIMNYSTESEPDELLRRPNVWEGKSWPYAWMQGHKLTVNDRILREHGSAPCQGCIELEAIEKLESALFQLVDGVATSEQAFEKDGWTAPMAAFFARFDKGWRSKIEGKSYDCDEVLLSVKRMVADAQDGWGNSKEVRLNDAGLKLYIKPVRSGMRIREVAFGLRVGGDQVQDYPGFREFAHAIFAEAGVPVDA